MRTTLALDDDALRVAKEKARTEGISIGKAVSALVMSGYEATRPAIMEKDGLLVVVHHDDRVITSAMVEDQLDDTDSLQGLTSD